MLTSPAESFSQLLPSAAVVSEHRLSVVDHATIPQHLLLPRAAQKRQLEFYAGRAAAGDALQRLGSEAVVVAKGEKREPVWPSGYVGSITHAGDWAVAAAAPQDRFQSIGIDLEVAAGIHERIAERVSSERECAAWALDPHGTGALLAQAAFCAKEALYKAVYPLYGSYFGFRAVELRVTAPGCFAAVSTSNDEALAPHVERVQGRVQMAGEYVFAACWIA